MTTGLIFLFCILLFISDRYSLAAVSLLGCVAFIVFRAGTLPEVFSGFTSDIVFIILGTEIFGVAFQESGLSTLIVRSIYRCTKNHSAECRTKKIIVVGGLIAAFFSAFLNNQVVCSLMLVICMNIGSRIKEIDTKDITLPIIYFAILGGQCTLIGAPSTLIASSISEKISGYRLSFFELLPMGLIITVVGMLYICIFGYKAGRKIWGKTYEPINESVVSLFESEMVEIDRKKCIVTAAAAILMLSMFLTEIFSVGTSSMIGALICVFFGAVDSKTLFPKIDWNIIIWLGCSIGMANVLCESGIIERYCNGITEHMSSDISPFVFLFAVIVLTTLISNFIANTTTVMIVLPLVLPLVQCFGWNVQPFTVSIAMSAGLSILTPLSCGFIGMTVRAGYRFRDYIKYGMVFQLILTASVFILTSTMYSFL